MKVGERMKIWTLTLSVRLSGHTDFLAFWPGKISHIQPDKSDKNFRLVPHTLLHYTISGRTRRFQGSTENPNK